MLILDDIVSWNSPIRSSAVVFAWWALCSDLGLLPPMLLLLLVALVCMHALGHRRRPPQRPLPELLRLKLGGGFGADPRAADSSGTDATKDEDVVYGGGVPVDGGGEDDDGVETEEATDDELCTESSLARFFAMPFRRLQARFDSALHTCLNTCLKHMANHMSNHMS